MPFRIFTHPRLYPLRFLSSVVGGCLTFALASQAMAQADIDYRCPIKAESSAAPVPVASSTVPPPPGPQAVAKPEDFAVAKTHSGFPRWGDFPPPPQNVPTAKDIRARVMTLSDVRRDYLSVVNRLEWDMTDPVAYQAQTIARIDQSKSALIETMTCEEVLEFARQKQKLATPPPVADN
jgi:hypothetical protein